MTYSTTQEDCRSHAVIPRLPAALRLYFGASLLFWAVCLAVISYWRLIAHRAFPYNSIFMQDVFARDLWCYQGQLLRLHSAAFFKPIPEEMFPYPPGSALPFALFCRLLPPWHSALYTSLTFSGVFVLLGVFVRALQGIGLSRIGGWLIAGAAFLLMYPFPFVLTTGNIEIVIFLLLATGVIAFLRGRFAWAAILIGFCGAMKLYPLVMVALLLSFRRYKEAALAVIAFVFFLVAGLWLECPDLRVAIHGTLAAMATNRLEYMQMYLSPQTMADHSIWGLVKTIQYISHRQVLHSSRSVSVYTAAMAATGLLLYFWRIRLLPVLNQICCLYLCLLLLVPESFEYTLLHLTVMWALLTLQAYLVQGQPRRMNALLPVFLGLAFVLSADNELVFHLHGVWGQAKCVVLLALLVMALRTRWTAFERVTWLAPELVSAMPQAAEA